VNPYRIAAAITLLVILAPVVRYAWVVMRDKDRAEEDGYVGFATLRRVRGLGNNE
jgi:hypothetical protein